MRALLLPFSYLYGAAMALRNMFFDFGILRVERVGVPVISVGNISTGGVGKTPFVELLARRFLRMGRKVAIVSRGYRRESSGTVVVSNGTVLCANADASGDEPAQMGKKLRGVVVIVDERRARGAKFAVERFGVDMVILDDGFQHRYIHRDLDVVLMSAEDVMTSDRLLPAGNWRESFSALGRADVIVVSQIGDRDQFLRSEERLHTMFQKPVVGVRTRVSALKKAASGFSLDVGGLGGKRVVAFAGIGEPKHFEATLNSLKLEIVKSFRFPDHHQFSGENLRSVEGAAQKMGADFIVTTEKDAARLGGLKSVAERFLEQNPVYYIEIEHEVIAGEQHLAEALAMFR